MAVNPALSGEPSWHRSLAPDEELRLAGAARAGDRHAAVRLAEAHLHVVVAIARQHAAPGVLFLHLVQEGSLGLLQAVRGFDPARGGRFSTFAYRRILHAVRSAAAGQRRQDRIPPATAQAIERMRSATDQLAIALDREPTAAELALELGTTQQRIGRLKRLSRLALSHGDLEGGHHVSDHAVLTALRVDLYALLARLSARERRVLRLRFGLVNGRRCSLEEIGRRLGLSEERVREIEAGALSRLRRATDAPSLAFLD